MTPIRKAAGWFWKWSGCPLIVPVAVVVLVLQTWYLAGPVNPPVGQCGAAKTWAALVDTELVRVVQRYTAKQYPSIGLKYRGERVPIYWDKTSSEFKDYRRVIPVSMDSFYWSFTVDPIHPRQTEGIWAPTRIRGDIEMVFFQHGRFNRETINRGFAAVYRSDSDDFEPAVYRALQNGQTKYSGVILSGYWHNFVAMALVGMIVRRCIGVKAWLRATFHLLRNRPRRRYSLFVRFGHPLRTLLVVAAVFLMHACVIGSGQGNHSGSGRIVGPYAPGSNRPRHPRKPLRFDYVRSSLRSLIVPAGRDPGPHPLLYGYNYGSKENTVVMAEVSIVEYGTKTRHGLWAPTSERTSYPLEINELQPLTQFERDEIRLLLIKVLHRYYVVPRSGKWSQSVAREESQRDEVIVAGYAHNVFALILALLMFRIILGYRAIQAGRLERRRCVAMAKEQAQP